MRLFLPCLMLQSMHRTYGFPVAEITTRLRAALVAGWQDPDRLLLSISSICAALCFEHLSTKHTLHLLGKQKHGSVLINGPSICKTLLALKLFSTLSVGVFGIRWQLGGAWGLLSQNNGVVLESTWSALTVHVWKHVWKYVLEWREMYNESPLAGQWVSNHQKVSCRTSCQLVWRKKFLQPHYKNNSSGNSVFSWQVFFFFFTMC